MSKFRTDLLNNPDSKINGAIMGPAWGRQDPGGPHVGHINFAIWEVYQHTGCKWLVHGTKHRKDKRVSRHYDVY